MLTSHDLAAPQACSSKVPRHSHLATSQLLTYFHCPVSESLHTHIHVEGQCAGTAICPLSDVAAGSVVCIKRLSADPDMKDRLRELGLREEQKIKLISRQSNFICVVCNARLGISEQLAENIFVEPLTIPAPSAGNA
jgi:Fe2+ transport system protein FeoA